MPTAMRQSERLFKTPPLPEDLTPTISMEALDQVKHDLQVYTALVLNSDLSQGSKDQYIDHADCFVRWLQGRFRPGQRVRAA